MDILNQAKNLIERAQNILIVPAQEIQGDNLGSALALLFTLKKLGKNANILIEKIPEKFQFLTAPQTTDSQDFVIFIDGSEKEISEMRYEKNEKGLKIYLTLKKGEINEKDVSFSTFNQKPNLLITLGAKSLEDLGNFFQQNSRIFYETPILNIDNQSSNENFGEINLVETTCSLSETSTKLIKLMEGIDEGLLDENIATCLLTGVVCASQNFRNSKTKPKTFEVSAFLIEKGADHQKITQRLYKQKSVSQIKILGRILEKLNLDEERELYCSSLTKKDFQDCGAQPKDLSFAVEELRFSFRYLPNLLILWESHASPALIKGIFYSQKPALIEKILENYESVSRGEGTLFLIRDSNLESAKENILKTL